MYRVLAAVLIIASIAVSAFAASATTTASITIPRMTAVHVSTDGVSVLQTGDERIVLEKHPSTNGVKLVSTRRTDSIVTPERSGWSRVSNDDAVRPVSSGGRSERMVVYELWSF